MTDKMSTEDNFGYLTGALILLLLFVALADQFKLAVGQVVFQAAIVMTLAAGVWTIRGDARWQMTRISFVVAIVIVAIGGLFLDLLGLDLLWLLILLAYLLLTIWLCFRQVLFTGSVDRNKIVGAACIFLLLGLAWATLYMALVEVVPDAFTGLESAHWSETFPDLVYFSFVTLTTLGYGDVGPAAPLARFLAYMEAIVGQFYIAIVVASLIGARFSR